MTATENRERTRWEPEVLLRLPYSGAPLYKATLRGLYKQTVQVVFDKAIAPASELKIVFGEIEIAGTVQYCRKWNGSFLISIRVESPPNSRRREPRLPVDCPCCLTAIADGYSRQLEAVIVDISASGIGIRMPQSLKTGTMVCVLAQDFVAAGQLLHCRYIGDGQFSGGIELTDIVWGEKREPHSWSGVAKKRLKDAWRSLTHQENETSIG